MHDFVFTRLQYDSGDWDVDQRMPSNLLNSLIEGHKPVEFDRTERANFERCVANGSFGFADDCNHDVDGHEGTIASRDPPDFFGKPPSAPPSVPAEGPF